MWQRSLTEGTQTLSLQSDLAEEVSTKEEVCSVSMYFIGVNVKLMLPFLFQGGQSRPWNTKGRFQKNGFRMAATTQFIAGWFMVTPIS